MIFIRFISRGFLPFCCAALLASQASAEHRHGGHDKWENQYRDGPCRVKEKYDRGDYLLEIKCPDGRGRSWSRGEWKEEFRDGACRVKIDAKRDEYKKEVKCKEWDDD
jgi:hypothetical protein